MRGDREQLRVGIRNQWVGVRPEPLSRAAVPTKGDFAETLSKLSATILGKGSDSRYSTLAISLIVNDA